MHGLQQYVKLTRALRHTSPCGGASHMPARRRPYIRRAPPCQAVPSKWRVASIIYHSPRPVNFLLCLPKISAGGCCRKLPVVRSQSPQENRPALPRRPVSNQPLLSVLFFYHRFNPAAGQNVHHIPREWLGPGSRTGRPVGHLAGRQVDAQHVAALYHAGDAGADQ